MLFYKWRKQKPPMLLVAKKKASYQVFTNPQPKTSCSCKEYTLLQLLTKAHLLEVLELVGTVRPTRRETSILLQYGAWTSHHIWTWNKDKKIWDTERTCISRSHKQGRAQGFQYYRLWKGLDVESLLVAL